MMRLWPARSMIMPACRIVVAGPPERVIGTLVAVMGAHGYRLRSRPGATPLTFQRGSVGSYALLAAVRRPGMALYAVVTVEPTVLSDGAVHLALVQTRAHHHGQSAPVLRSAVAEAVRRYAADGTLRFAGPLRPAREGAHLEVASDGQDGYRGQTGPDGAPLAWAP